MRLSELISVSEAMGFHRISLVLVIDFILLFLPSLFVLTIFTEATETMEPTLISWGTRTLYTLVSTSLNSTTLTDPEL